MIVIFPHYKSSGGAGKYISNIINRLLEHDMEFIVAGVYAKCYQKSHKKKSIIFKLILYFFSLLSYPSYDGVSFRAKLYYLTLLPVKFTISILLYFLCYLFCFNFIKSKKFTFVLTSSIQIPILIFSLLNNNLRFVVIIQENLIFRGWLGRVLIYLLNKSYLTVSISSDWYDYAKMNGVFNLEYVPNTYSCPDDKCFGPELLYDCIYVGGGQNIKGFYYLCEEIKRIKDGKYVFCLLGDYSPSQVRMVADISLNSKCIDVFILGCVDSIYPYLYNSKLLLLPITHAHFCRPAIEAGLCGRTFLVSDLSGLDDFAIDDFNCKKFPLIDGGLSNSIKDLLNNEESITNLSHNNHGFAMNSLRLAELATEDFVKSLGNSIK
ncbi:hypothetical protein VCSRO177_2253 [Vibrio cholerae]|nr:putative glycosyltransferase [Vibrio cholerae]GHZ93430.1 hypothetical protein VCSRO177_2253 [Vibrio cholerae]